MSSAAIPDAELGVLARSRDVQALAALLEHCRPSLYATAMGLLGNRADALDAVQETCVVALTRFGDVRDVAAARGWLHKVLRNVCLMRLRQRREISLTEIEIHDTVPGPEQALEHHALRDWVWEALGHLTPDERVTVILRHFTRCTSYEAIAQITAVPVGTVRSRLNRARSRLVNALLTTVAATPLSHADLVAGQRQTWEDFYRMLHNRPEARTYQDLFAADVEVRDTVGHWHGISEWAAEERQAISAGVRATLVDVLAGRDVTVLEIDFSNPPDWPDHCPPQATFVHRLKSGQSAQLLIHYPQRMAF